ncbi:RAD10 [Malassezia furfur]|nr:RAD10 [Malassezia furfur]
MAQAREDASPQRARPHPLIRGAQASSNSILVNSCQRGNPILQHIKGVAWEYADIVPDYQVGLSSGVLFLSLRYFRLHPEQEEAARYLETYKAFEQRPPDLIRTRVGETYSSQLAAVLTSVRGINKTDVMTLSTHIGSLADMARAPPEKLAMLPGMGEVKVDNLTKAFRQAFRTDRVYRKPTGTAALRDAGPSRAVDDPTPRDADDPVEVADTPAEPAASDALQESEPGTLEGLPDNFESLPEEEQLRIAMELSVNGFM